MKNLYNTFYEFKALGKHPFTKINEHIAHLLPPKEQKLLTAKICRKLKFHRMLFLISKGAIISKEIIHFAFYFAI